MTRWCLAVSHGLQLPVRRCLAVALAFRHLFVGRQNAMLESFLETFSDGWFWLVGLDMAQFHLSLGHQKAAV